MVGPQFGLWRPSQWESLQNYTHPDTKERKNLIILHIQEFNNARSQPKLNTEISISEKCFFCYQKSLGLFYKAFGGLGSSLLRIRE